MRFVNTVTATVAGVASLVRGASAAQCSAGAVRFKIDDPPYTNFFYSDCNSATQVVATSPLPVSDLKVIGPRLLVCGLL